MFNYTMAKFGWDKFQKGVLLPLPSRLMLDPSSQILPCLTIIIICLCLRLQLLTSNFVLAVDIWPPLNTQLLPYMFNPITIPLQAGMTYICTWAVVFSAMLHNVYFKKPISVLFSKLYNLCRDTFSSLVWETSNDWNCHQTGY